MRTEKEIRLRRYKLLDSLTKTKEEPNKTLMQFEIRILSWTLGE